MKRYPWQLLPTIVALAVLVMYWRDRNTMAERTSGLETRIEAMLAAQRQLTHAVGQRPAIVSVERGAASECATAPANSAEHAPAVVAAVPQNTAAHRDAWAAVDTVLAKRTWTEADRQRYGPLFRSLDDAERERVITTLFDAMNRGDVAPSDVAPM